MTLNRAALELVALLDIVISCVGVVLATAAAILGVALRLRLRASRASTYTIAVPPGSPPASELLFTHLHSLLRPAGSLSPSPEIAVAVIASSDGLALTMSMPERYRSPLEASLDAVWPGATLTRTDLSVRPEAKMSWRPILVAPRRSSVITGATAAFVRALMRTPSGEQLSFEIALRPARRRPPLVRGLFRTRTAQISGLSKVATPRDDAVQLFDIELVISAHAATSSRARTLVREFLPNVEALCAGTGMQLRRPAPFTNSGPTTAGGTIDGGLAASDLALLFPLAALAENAQASPSLADGGERLIGRRRTRRADADVRISLVASRHHLHVIGPTGTGKSTLLLNLIVQDIEAGRGCALLDPKGDLVHELLARIPRQRVADVVYIGPEEGRRVVGINPLSLRPDEDPHLACENVLAIFKRIYEDNWGPRTDDVLKSCLLTLVAVPGATIAHIPALLTNPALRKRYLAHVDDEIGVGGFWRWYDQVSEGKRQEVTAPLQNKLRDVLVRPRLRRLLCQARSTVDLRRLIDDGGILLADLGSGRWGESASALAGSFLVARLWQAALSRQAVLEDRRRDFLLYVDEFQSFLGIGGPFADALAQARGLRLSLTLANQHLGQLPRDIRDAVTANARSRVVFRSSAADSTALAAELPPLEPSVLVSLEPYEAGVRLVTSTSASTIRTLPAAPRRIDAARSDEVLDASASRHGRDLAVVESELRASLRSEVGEESLSEKA